MNTSSQNLTRRRWWALLKFSIFILVLVFIVQRAAQLWASAPSQSFEVNGLWLIPAGLIYFVTCLPSLWFWRALLQDMHQQVPVMAAIRAYYVGNMGKYVPGKALVLVIRGSMLKDSGVNPVLAGATAAYETLVFMATGAMWALVFAPFVFGDAVWSQLPSQLGWLREHPAIFSVAVIAVTFATTPFSAWIFTQLGRKTMSGAALAADVQPAISAKRICQGVLVTSLGWACSAISLGCVLQSLSTRDFDWTQFPLWVVASTLSTVGGFVILIAPGGIGVREGLLIEALKDQAHIGPTLAVVAAGLLRVVWFVTELLAAVILLLTRRRAN